METNNLMQKIWDELKENEDSYAFDYSDIEDETNYAIEVALRKYREEIKKELKINNNVAEIIGEFDIKHIITQIILVGKDGAVRNIEFKILKGSKENGNIKRNWKIK